MAGLLQCVVTRRADEPIHLSREIEREGKRKARGKGTVSTVDEEAGEREPTGPCRHVFCVVLNYVASWASVMKRYRLIIQPGS